MPPEPAAPSSHARRPAILVAEDDPASGQYFTAALQACGWEATVERDGVLALARARQHRFDVLVLDCHMPGPAAAQILSTLRADRAAASHASPAIATSAELGPRLSRELEQAGFARTLPKPVAMERLQGAIRDLLAPGAHVPAALLDDAAAIQSSGSAAAVGALRGLFAGELGRLANELTPLATDPPRFAARLHRLLASCGFCGARALADASRRLKQQLDRDGTPAAAEMEDFRRTLASTLHLLAAQVREDTPQAPTSGAPRR